MTRTGALSRMTLLAVVSAAVMIFTSEVAQACMAISLPNVRVMRQGPIATQAPGAVQRVRYVAFFSEYTCAAMPPKTFCALGICFRPGPELKKANVQVQSMRFVEQDKGEPIPGFDPKPNALTGRSFRQRKEGVWYGFASRFERKFDREGGVEVKVEFSVAPGTTDDTIKAILADAFIGAAGGNKDGRVVDGHHLEIIRVSKVALVGQERATGTK